MADLFAKFGDLTAICYNDEKHTYADLDAKISALFTKYENLSNKVVCVNLSPSYEFIATFFALYLRKCIILPMIEFDETRLEFGEILLDKTGTKRLNSPKTHTLIQKLKNANISGLILYSSATTGKAKAMLHNLDAFIEIFSKKEQKNYALLLTLLIDHIGGLDCVFGTLFSGARLSIPPDLAPTTICASIEKYKISVFPTTPTMLNLILISKEYEKYNLSSLKIITYGAESMSEELLKRIQNVFKDIKIFQKFGTSETGSFSTKNMSKNSLFMEITDKNIEYKIINDELWLKSKTQILGYLNCEDEFENGWFKTGDLVRQDGKFLQIIGRNKEMVNIGGNKVLPNEVENVIMQINGVLDVIIYGKSSLIMGEILCADIVANAKISKSDIINECKKILPKHKIPTQINFVKEISVNKRYKKQRIKAQI